MSILIGLTGNIGAGKSLAASYFRIFGARIIDADHLSRQIVEPYQAAWKEIIEVFGLEYFNKDKTLNRKKIATEVFQNKNKLVLLEKIIHHRVLAEEQKLYHSYKKSDPKAIVIIDSPLLIESKNHKNVDKVILVKCSIDLQIQRVRERNGEPEEKIINRINMQMPLKEKLKYSDYILYNKGTQDELKSQVCKLYQVLKSLV